MPAPKKRAKVSRSPAERPARSRRELTLEHIPPVERDDRFVEKPAINMHEEELPAQKPRARKTVKVWSMAIVCGTFCSQHVRNSEWYMTTPPSIRACSCRFT